MLSIKVDTIPDEPKPTVNRMVSLGRTIYYLGMDGGIVKSNPFARRGMFKEEPKGRYIEAEDYHEADGIRNGGTKRDLTGYGGITRDIGTLDRDDLDFFARQTVSEKWVNLRGKWQMV